MTRQTQRHGDRAEVLEPVERVAEHGPVFGQDPDVLARRDARGGELAGRAARTGSSPNVHCSPVAR